MLDIDLKEVIDPNSTFDGMHLASEMILENCGGDVGSIIKDSGKVINQEIIIDSSFIKKTFRF